MNRLFSSLITLGMGAGLMYFLDPENGRRRQAEVRDRVSAALRKSDLTIHRTMKDFRNRTRGMMYETASWLRSEPTADWILEERIRSKLGHWSANPGAIDIRVENGVVYLTGAIIQAEVDELASNIRDMQGVENIENQMDIYVDPAYIPNQGEESANSNGAEDFRGRWTPTARLASSMGAGAMLIYGRGRKGLIGSVLSLAGLGLAFRALTNLELARLLGGTEKPDIDQSLNNPQTTEIPMD